MQRAALVVTLMLIATTAQVRAAGDCVSPEAPQARKSAVANAPMSPELAATGQQSGAPPRALARDASDETLSVVQVLSRVSGEDCLDVAKVASSAGSTGIPAPIDPAAYKPRTEFDNTPWRFDMNQNGKSMTADEFTAWMEAKGVRVVNRAPVAAALAAPGTEPPTSPVVPVSGDTPAEPVATEDGGAEN